MLSQLLEISRKSKSEVSCSEVKWCDCWCSTPVKISSLLKNRGTIDNTRLIGDDKKEKISKYNERDVYKKQRKKILYLMHNCFCVVNLDIGHVGTLSINDNIFPRNKTRAINAEHQGHWATSAKEAASIVVFATLYWHLCVTSKFLFSTSSMIYLHLENF